MSSAVAAAVIAAAVPVAVAVGSVAVTFVTTRATLRRDHERQAAEFRRVMTARLYDRRVATYPGLFAATDAFRNSRLDAAQDLHRHLADALGQVDRWHAGEGGLILSDRVYGQLLGLRQAVRYLHESAGSEQLSRLRQEIWQCKGHFALQTPGAGHRAGRRTRPRWAPAGITAPQARDTSIIKDLRQAHDHQAHACAM